MTEKDSHEAARAAAATVQRQRLIELHDWDMARVSESLNAVTTERDYLRRQIEAALAALDQSDLFAPTAEYIEAAWALRSKIRAALAAALVECQILPNSDCDHDRCRAALSSVPDVPAARDEPDEQQ